MHDGDMDVHSWGEPLVRIGFVANRLELRVAGFPKAVLKQGIWQCQELFPGILRLLFHV